MKSTSKSLERIKKDGSIPVHHPLLKQASAPLAGIWSVSTILKSESPNKLDGYFVYAIWDNCSDRPIYVGMTCRGFIRIHEHFTFRKGKYNPNSPVSDLLEIAREKGWTGWRVSFFGPLQNESVTRSLESGVDRFLKPWHSSRSWSKSRDWDEDAEDLPWYICEYLYRSRLKAALREKVYENQRQENLALRLVGGHELEHWWWA